MLKEEIDNFYITDERENKPQEKIYCTDVGKCNRAVFFSFKNAPKKPLDPRTARIFARGNKMHTDIFGLLCSVPSIQVIATEIHIPDHPFLTGRADAIVNVRGENYILDIKSINSFIFKKMENAQIENIQQVQLYLHFFNIEKGILLYIDKDKQEIREYIVQYNPQMVHYILQNFKKLKDMIDKNELPPVLGDYPANWQCSYCRFRETCDKVGTSKTLCQ